MEFKFAEDLKNRGFKRYTENTKEKYSGICFKWHLIFCPQKLITPDTLRVKILHGIQPTAHPNKLARRMFEKIHLFKNPKTYNV